LSAPYEPRVEPEQQDVLTRLPLLVLAGGAVVLGLCAPFLYSELVVPFLPAPPFTIQAGIFENPTGAFVLYPIILVLALGFVCAVYAAGRARRARFSGPYLSGAQTADTESFEGPMRKPVAVSSGIYCFESIFGEERLTVWFNICGGILLALLIGGAV